MLETEAELVAETRIAGRLVNRTVINRFTLRFSVVLMGAEPLHGQCAVIQRSL